MKTNNFKFMVFDFYGTFIGMFRNEIVCKGYCQTYGFHYEPWQIR